MCRFWPADGPPTRANKWSDIRKLMTYALQNYEYRDVFDESPLPVLPVENGQYEELGIGEEAVTALSYGVPAGELSLDLLLKEDEQVEVVRDLPQTLAAPVRQGQQVGCGPVSAERPGAERVSGV